jgi:hypothetical protein
VVEPAGDSWRQLGEYRKMARAESGSFVLFHMAIFIGQFDKMMRIHWNWGYPDFFGRTHVLLVDWGMSLDRWLVIFGMEVVTQQVDQIKGMRNLLK